MKCALCNGRIVKRNGPYPFPSKIVGLVVIPDIQYEQCQQCGEKTFTADQSQKIVSFIRTREEKAIANLPAGDLVTATEAAAILGKTKQAFSKDPRVKKGLVYFVKVGNRRLYSKKSIKKYKETKKDGLFYIEGWADKIPETRQSFYDPGDILNPKKEKLAG